MKYGRVREVKRLKLIPGKYCVRGVEGLGVEYMKDAVYQAILIGDADRAADSVLEALEEGEDPQRILNEQMIAAMVEVGRLYEDQKYFIPEMMISARPCRVLSVP